MAFKRVTRNSICAIIASLLVILGFVKRAKTRAFQQNAITAIFFHNPSEKLFRKIVHWLAKNGYQFISSDTLIKIINKEIECPKGAVWISLDDGWKKNLKNVIPIAVQYDIPVTIFVCTNAVDEGTFWWRKVRQSPDILPTQFQNTEAIRELPESMRKEVISSFVQNNSTFQREAMTVEDIKAIASIPQITLGAHTASHPILPNCKDDQIRYELTESKKTLEDWVGKQITTFAYPNGAFSGREKPFLEECGYELAATTESEFITPDSDRFFLPRNELVDDGSFSENLCHVVGIWQPLIRKFKQLG